MEELDLFVLDWFYAKCKKTIIVVTVSACGHKLVCYKKCTRAESANTEEKASTSDKAKSV